MLQMGYFPDMTHCFSIKTMEKCHGKDAYVF